MIRIPASAMACPRVDHLTQVVPGEMTGLGASARSPLQRSAASWVPRDTGQAAPRAPDPFRRARSGHLERFDNARPTQCHARPPFPTA